MSGDKSHMRTQDELTNCCWSSTCSGSLTEEEQVRVEDRAFADREYMSAIDAAEADLIDAYVSGDLPQADRRAFESRFLTSPQRRSKVEFAQALARVTCGSTASRFCKRTGIQMGGVARKSSGHGIPLCGMPALFP